MGDHQSSSYQILILKYDQLTPDQISGMRRLHCECFPGQTEELLTDEAFLEEVAFTQEPQDCVWALLLLHQGTPPPAQSTDSCGAGTGTHGPGSATARASAQPGKAQAPAARVVGMATGCPHTRALYCFNLAVAPGLRKRGLGELLMRAMAVEGAARGLPRLTASVSSSAPRLLSYYLHHGGRVITTASVCGPGSTPPPSVTLEVLLSERDPAAALARAWQRVISREQRDRRAYGSWLRTPVQQLGSVLRVPGVWGAVVQGVAASTAAMLLVSVVLRAVRARQQA